MHEKSICITHPEAKDIPTLEKIWMDAFGDPRKLITAFFDRYPPTINGWIVRRGAEILSTAYLILDNVLLEDDHPVSAGYVYAVAAPQEYRGKGYGAALMRHFTGMADAQGLLLYTRPANSRLFHWYAETMQTVPASPMKQELITVRDVIAPPSVHRLSPAVYGSAREILLSKQPHIVLSESFLSLQEVYLVEESGGYYGCGDSVCACEMHGDTLVVKELLTHGEDEPVLLTLLSHFHLSRAMYFVPAEDGAAHVAFRGSAPEKTCWGLLLD